jgi:hypothetical protein
VSAGELVDVELPVLRCAVCDTAWVLRLAFVFGTKTTESRYLWQRDCGHKSAGPRPVDSASAEWAFAGAARAK